ncbi:MAG TPA: EamA family transporter [Candidatus Cybelea sp.]|nr:EamA family transporter [Candidatus Cybelea sp.]
MAKSRGASTGGSILLLLGLALLWGYNWVVLKIGIADSGPVAFGAVRMIGGAAILVAVLLAMRRSFRIVEPLTVAAIGLFQTAGAQGSIAMALRSGEAGKSAVLNYTLPIWVMILGFLFFDERPRAGQWLATAVALAGIVLMAFLGGKAGSLEPVLFALGASFSWGVGVVITQGLLRRHPEGIDTVVLTTWQMVIGGALLGIAALIVPEAPLQWTPAFILAVLYNVGPATAGAFLIWFTLQRRIEANTLSLIVLIVPLVGVVAGSIQLGERPSLTDTIGMALILVAIAMMVLTQPSKGPATITIPQEE